MTIQGIILQVLPSTSKVVVGKYGEQTGKPPEIVELNIPTYLKRNARIGFTLVEDYDGYSIQDPLRNCVINEFNELVVKTIVDISKCFTSSYNNADNVTVGSVDFGTVICPRRLCEEMKKQDICLAQVGVKLKKNVDVGEYFLELVPHVAITRVMHIETFDRFPYFNSTATVYGPMLAVVIQRMPGKYLLYNELGALLLTTDDRLFIGDWILVKARKIPPDDSFAIISEYETLVITKGMKAPILTRLDNETSAMITFITKGKMVVNQYTNEVFIRTARFVDLPWENAVEYPYGTDEDLAVVISLEKNDTKLIPRLTSVDKLLSFEHGIVVGVDVNVGMVAVRHEFFALPDHIVDFFGSFKVGDVVAVQLSENMYGRKKVFICEKTGMSMSCVHNYVEMETSLVPIDRVYNGSREPVIVYKADFNIHFVDTRHLLTPDSLPSTVFLSCEYIGEAKFEWTLVENVDCDTSSSYYMSSSYLDTTVDTLDEQNLDDDLKKNSNDYEQSSQVDNTPMYEYLEKQIAGYDVLHSCQCEQALLNHIRRPTPNHLVKKESVGEVRVLIVAIHRSNYNKSEVHVACYALNGHSFDGLFVTAFGPGREAPPEDLAIGKWYKITMQSVLIGGQSRRLYRWRATYGIEWCPPEAEPKYPGKDFVEVDQNGYQLIHIKAVLTRNHYYEYDDCCVFQHAYLGSVVVSKLRFQSIECLAEEIHEEQWECVIEPLPTSILLHGLSVCWKAIVVDQRVKVVLKSDCKVIPTISWEDTKRTEPPMKSTYRVLHIKEKNLLKKQMKEISATKLGETITKEVRLKNISRCTIQTRRIFDAYPVTSYSNGLLCEIEETLDSDDIRKKDKIRSCAHNYYKISKDRETCRVLEENCFYAITTMNSIIGENVTYLTKLIPTEEVERFSS